MLDKLLSLDQVCIVLISLMLLGCATNSNGRYEEGLILRQYVDELNNFNLRKPTKKTSIAAEALLEDIEEQTLTAAEEGCEKLKKNDACSDRWDIKLVQRDAFNAYATNSREIVLFQGLINQVRYDEEVIFVLLHEIGHHAHDHISKTQTRAGVGMVAGAILGGAVGSLTGDPSLVSNTMIDGAAIGGQIGALAYSVSQEKEADAFAVEVMEELDLDMDKARYVLIRMAKMSARMHTAFLDSHPSGPDRLHSFDNEVSKRLRID